MLTVFPDEMLVALQLIWTPEDCSACHLLVVSPAS